MAKKMTLNAFVATRIRAIRKNRKMSQEQLSIEAELDPRYVNKFENNRYNARLDTVERLLDTLGVSYSEFFQFDLQVNSPELAYLLQLLAEYPEEVQREKLKAINQLLEK